MSDVEISTKSGSSGNANLIYILYLVGVIIGVTALVGVIMAYISKSDADEVTLSHYNNQINIFWKLILYSVVSAILSVVIIGLFMLLATAIWYIVRSVKGMQALGRGEPIANPGSWGF